MQNELYHHGIKGMKWGIRRYQNKDGSLTPQGKKKYEKNRRAAAGKTKQERVAEFAKAIATKLATGDTGNLQDGGESALPF